MGLIARLATKSVLLAVASLGGASETRAESPPPGPPPTSVTPSPSPARGGHAKEIFVDMTFMDKSGVELGNRRTPVGVGRTKVISVRQRGRIIAADTTVGAATGDGCWRVDVVLHDKTINAKGRYNETVWRSGTNYCEEESLVLGPDMETKLRISLKPRTAGEKPQRQPQP